MFDTSTGLNVSMFGNPVNGGSYGFSGKIQSRK
jgi:hypothetical protein